MYIFVGTYHGRTFEFVLHFVGCVTEQLPSEEDVEKLKNYIVSRMKELLDDKYRMWNTQDFKEIRDLAVSRLTLFNGRRGEPARMSLAEYKDAITDAWINRLDTYAPILGT